MRHTLLNRFAFALLLLAPLSQVALSQAANHRKPNVLFISIDDLNNDLGCYGHPVVKSPNIDRLAARGVRFDRAYTQYPLCNPSRASLLSGRSPETTRIFELQTAPRKAMPDAVFLPQLFRRHGYFTARYGKVYHDWRDDQLSWDVSSDPPFGDEQEREADRRRFSKPAGTRTADWMPLDTPDEQMRDGYTARAIARLMEEQTQAGKPFFLAAGFHKPHLPWGTPKKYFTMYAPERLTPLPDEPMKNIPPIALLTDIGDAPQPSSRPAAMAAYYATISFMDAQVGVLLAVMDRLRLWENTIVVLFSDHGFHLGDHGGLWAKLTLFEQSARVPLVIYTPMHDKQAGKSSLRTVELLDVYPTLAEACGLSLPPGLEGKSLMPLLRQPNAAWNRPARTMVLHREVEGHTVRTERWRYTEWAAGKQGVELYDHRADPREFNNLANDARYSQTVAKMKKLLPRFQ
jgi:uncharacterized sulfatase